MLTERSDSVQEELVTVINDKYVEFLDLSGSTKKLKGLVQPIEEPLRMKTEAMEGFCGELDEVRKWGEEMRGGPRRRPHSRRALWSAGWAG